MAGVESLKHINNTPWEKTLEKINQFERVEKAQRQEREKMRERKKAVSQLTDALLDFSRKFLSISKESIAKLEPEECQTLFENLLLRARQKRRLPWRICGTVAGWVFWAVAITLSFVLIEDKKTAGVVILFSGVFGGLVALALTDSIWNNSTTFCFFNAYNKCLGFTDKLGALLVEHARESVKKEIPQ